MAAYAVTLLTPGVNGDIRDYQQYITGERIDGMFVAVGAIGSIVTLITNAALPELYDRSGLNEEVAKASVLTEAMFMRFFPTRGISKIFAAF